MINDNLAPWQRDLLATTQQQLEAYLDAMKAWRATWQFDATAGAAPTPPPFVTGSAWDSQEVVDANRALIEGLAALQQEFLMKLNQILTGPPSR